MSRSWPSSLAFLLLLAAAPAVRAQEPRNTPIPLPDSVQAALARYRAAVAAADSCKRYPELLPDTTPRAAHAQHRRDPRTARECWTDIPPELHQPIAFVVDGRLVCPSMRPAEWAQWGGPAGVQPDEILRLEVSRDSAVLARVRCPVPAFGLIWITTNRPARDTTH